MRSPLLPVEQALKTLCLGILVLQRKNKPLPGQMHLLQAGQYLIAQLIDTARTFANKTEAAAVVEIVIVLQTFHRHTATDAALAERQILGRAGSAVWTWRLLRDMMPPS